LFIASRYLQSRRKNGFINLITYISVFGVAIGVAALIIVLSVMNGFESEVRSRIIGFDTHIRVRKYHYRPISDYRKIMESLRDIPQIEGLSPYIDEKGIIRYGDESEGILIRGADPVSVREVSDLDSNIVDGELNLGPVAPQPIVILQEQERETGISESVEETGARHLPGMVMGRWLADRFWIGVRDTVFLISVKGLRSMYQVPKVKAFVVAGLFETGFFEFDNTYVYISNAAAQDLYNMGDEVSGIEVRLQDMNQAGSVKEIIESRTGSQFVSETWFELRKNLFSWMQLEKWAMFIILCLIILVAAFNIVSTLIMVVMEKTREIGILKSMGATSRSITRIFLYEGIFVGVSGTLLGLIVGYALCRIQQVKKLISLPGDVYFINNLPVKMEIPDFMFVAVAAVIICLTAAIYPARRASRMIPVDAIRYE
jgi:lipoprotein-releasing system permease protein